MVVALGGVLDVVGVVGTQVERPSLLPEAEATAYATLIDIRVGLGADA